MNRKRTAAAVAVTALGLLGVPAAADAHGGHDRVRTIEARDDCDPKTFNAILGDGACVGDGDTEFDELIEELIEDGEHGKWDFHADKATLRRGGSLHVKNTGGEFHTFTEVPRFGGGCVDELNELLGLEPPLDAEGKPICTDEIFFTTGLPPGGSLPVADLDPGKHRFLCLIHPWMHATVTVENRR